MQESHQKLPETAQEIRTAGDVRAVEAPAKADLGKRFVAIFIDSVVAAVLAAVPMIGFAVAAAYWLVRDGLEFDFMDRRSLGKKVMKLRPLRLDGAPMDIATSIKRNWMYALGAVGLIPMIGWLLLIPIGFAAFGIGVYEVIKVFTDERGRRLGDLIAETVVVEVED